MIGQCIVGSERVEPRWQLPLAAACVWCRKTPPLIVFSKDAGAWDSGGRDTGQTERLARDVERVVRRVFAGNGVRMVFGPAWYTSRIRTDAPYFADLQPAENHVQVR